MNGTEMVENALQDSAFTPYTVVQNGKFSTTRSGYEVKTRTDTVVMLRYKVSGAVFTDKITAQIEAYKRICDTNGWTFTERQDADRLPYLVIDTAPGAETVTVNEAPRIKTPQDVPTVSPEIIKAERERILKEAASVFRPKMNDGIHYLTDEGADSIKRYMRDKVQAPDAQVHIWSQRPPIIR